MSEMRRVVSSDSLFFNRVILKPNVSDVFIKSITVIDSLGQYRSIIDAPFVLDQNIIIKNKYRNSIAIEISIEHPFLNPDDDISKYVDIDINRIELSSVARIETKTSKILNAGKVNFIVKSDDAESTIISANVGIRGYSYDDIEILNENVRIGIGKTREMLSFKDSLDYDAESIFKYKNRMISRDTVEVKDRKISDYDNTCIYVYKPKYLKDGLDVYPDIYVDGSNSIVINNKNVHRLECSLTADVLDIDGSEPLIKYIGVISK